MAVSISRRSQGQKLLKDLQKKITQTSNFGDCFINFPRHLANTTSGPSQHGPRIMKELGTISHYPFPNSLQIPMGQQKQIYSWGYLD